MLYNNHTSHNVVIILNVKNLVFLLRSTIKTHCLYMLESPLLYGHPISFIKKKPKQPPTLQQSSFHSFCSKNRLKFCILSSVHLQSLALKVTIDNFQTFGKVMNTIQGQTRCPSVVSCYLTLASSECLSV